MAKIKKKIIRQSKWVLAIQLLGIELIVLLLYLLLRLFVFALDYFSSSPTFLLQIKIYEILIIIILSIIQMSLIIAAVISWINESFLLYKNTLVHQRGLFSLKEDIYYLQNIQDLQVRQGFLSRLMNFGSVRFFSPDLGRRITLMNISNPKRVEELISKMRTESAQPA